MASTYLTRSLASTNTSWTFSAWVKRSGITATNYLISWGNSGTDGAGIGFNADDSFEYYSESSPDNKNKRTSAKYRDTNAWYHVVCKCDSNAITLYVNGEEPTQSWVSGSSANPLDTSTMQIAKWVTAPGYYHNGSMSHVHFIDGTAYTPSAFGSTDATTGEWKINTSPSVTYGTNGFFILKDGNSVTDQSGNSNNFTVGGGTLTKTEDSPSNVFATLNPLVNINSNLTLSKGNNTMTLGSTNWIGTVSSLGISSGKYYWEIKVDTNNFMHGILGETANMTELSTSNSGYIGKFSNGYAFYYQSPTVRKQNNSSGSTYGTAPSSGDILMVAFDATNGTIWVGKNGTWFNSATQSEIENGTTTNSMYSSIPMTETFFPATCGESNHVANYNFGNGYFGTTAVSSAGTNASGNGIFEYDVPTGYTALSTKGLNL